MGIYQDLADQLKDIQGTTFGIDAIGNRICSPWDRVNVANETQRFDIVVVGAGMFGAYCAEKLFRRDASKKLRILVLDAGAFFLPTHVKNLPLSGMSNAVVWTRPWTGNKAFLEGGKLRREVQRKRPALEIKIGARSPTPSS